MIDIHSHVLPGLDDGARSMAEALRMLELAAATGTTDIVATPHVSPAVPNDFGTMQRTFDEVSRAAEGLLRLHLGCDFHLTSSNLRHFLTSPESYTINGRKYLMVELSDYIPFGPVGEALERILDRGVVPVVTHPERNPSLQQDGRPLRSWVDRGCLCQVTGQSLLGRFGSRARAMSERLLREGLVHVVASDGHDLVRRPPTLEPAYHCILERYGRRVADRLCVINPERIILGQSIDPVARPISLWSRIRNVLGTRA